MKIYIKNEKKITSFYFIFIFNTCYFIILKVLVYFTSIIFKFIII